MTLELLASFIIITLSYCIGSIPFGLLVTRGLGKADIRKMGSGNIGATNVLRTSGKRLGAITLALDAGKGAFAVIMATSLTTSEWTIAFASTAVVIGHIYPVWLKFNGGKGVATTLAVYWVIGWPLGIFACMVWAISFVLWRLSSLSSILAMLFSPVIAAFYTNIPFFVMSVTLGAIILLRHQENIGRLLRGEELPVQSQKKTTTTAL